MTPTEPKALCSPATPAVAQCIFSTEIVFLPQRRTLCKCLSFVIVVRERHGKLLRPEFVLGSRAPEITRWISAFLQCTLIRFFSAAQWYHILHHTLICLGPPHN